MIRFYRFPMSTNCDRVALALAHKGLEAESVGIDPADRSPVREISGQPLVPVLDLDGEILADSMVIVRRLEGRFPERPLYPPDPARRAEMEIFIEWFNKVWKVPPNAMEGEMSKPHPDQKKLDAWAAQVQGYLTLFEGMLAGRDHLFGEEFSAADVCAWPFLRYALLPDENDPWLFHRILVDHQRLEDSHPRLEAWIRRVARRPRA